MRKRRVSAEPERKKKEGGREGVKMVMREKVMTGWSY